MSVFHGKHLFDFFYFNTGTIKLTKVVALSWQSRTTLVCIVINKKNLAAKESERREEQTKIK